MSVFSKPDLRREFLARLRAMSPAEKSEGSAVIRDALLAWAPFREARTVLLYCPLPSEPDLLPLLEHPDCQDKVFAFPLTHPDRTLTLHQAGSVETFLTATAFGLREPDPARFPAVPVAQVDVALIPGLAFTPQGTRLGRGGGYYDRFLPTLPAHSTTGGIAFPCQITGDLPTEPHDIPVLPILTTP